MRYLAKGTRALHRPPSAAAVLVAGAAIVTGASVAIGVSALRAQASRLMLRLRQPHEVDEEQWASERCVERALDPLYRRGRRG